MALLSNTVPSGVSNTGTWKSNIIAQRLKQNQEIHKTHCLQQIYIVIYTLPSQLGSSWETQGSYLWHPFQNYRPIWLAHHCTLQQWVPWMDFCVLSNHARSAEWIKQENEVSFPFSMCNYGTKHIPKIQAYKYWLIVQINISKSLYLLWTWLLLIYTILLNMNQPNTTVSENNPVCMHKYQKIKITINVIFKANMVSSKALRHTQFLINSFSALIYFNTHS